MRVVIAPDKFKGSLSAPEVVEHLVSRGIPVCGHLGYTPQRVHALGVRVQGKGEAAAAQLKRDSRALSEAGAAMLVLEMVPSAVGAAVTADNPDLLTIGIGAGGEVSGQVLVLHDMLGLGAGRKPRFVRDFTAEGGSIAAAVGRYVAAVKDGSYPREGVHTY